MGQAGSACGAPRSPGRRGHEEPERYGYDHAEETGEVVLVVKGAGYSGEMVLPGVPEDVFMSGEVLCEAVEHLEGACRRQDDEEHGCPLFRAHRVGGHEADHRQGAEAGQGGEGAVRIEGEGRLRASGQKEVPDTFRFGGDEPEQREGQGHELERRETEEEDRQPPRRAWEELDTPLHPRPNRPQTEKKQGCEEHASLRPQCRRTEGKGREQEEQREDQEDECA